MKNANELIAAIASEMTEDKKPLSAIRDTLEDGEALSYLGATDDDQDLVEEAHDMVSAWMRDGLETLDQAK